MYNARSSCNKFAVVWMGLMSARQPTSQPESVNAGPAGVAECGDYQQRKSLEGNTVLQDTLQKQVIT